jgi:hypothetical protein
MLTSQDKSRIGKLEVGVSPVGILLLQSPKRIVVADSNRFSNDISKGELLVIDPTLIGKGPGAILGMIAAAGLPRDLEVTHDGMLLVINSFAAGSLQVMDLRKVSSIPCTNDSSCGRLQQAETVH